MGKYDDIINLKHYEPKHPRMSRYKRASQFAPFSALTGYSDEIKEVSRLTDKKIEIDDNIKDLLNRKLQILNDNINEDVTITYFIKDNKKEGGYYKTIITKIKKLDKVNGNIILFDKTIINIKDILSIKSEKTDYNY